jgi:hypothetical protein
MPDIKKSIIVYNGGSGGDFLKIMCLQQLNYFVNYNLTSSGRIQVVDQYFKEFTNKINCANTIDYNQIAPVDNTHFYHPWFNDIANVYYIDYPKELQDILIKIYMIKVNCSPDEFLHYHMEFIPTPLQKYINLTNIDLALNIQFNKNINTWRNTPNLIKIDMLDFFNQLKFKNIVELLCNHPLTNKDVFLQSYNIWIDKNKILVDSIS